MSLSLRALMTTTWLESVPPYSGVPGCLHPLRCTIQGCLRFARGVSFVGALGLNGLSAKFNPVGML